MQRTRYVKYCSIAAAGLVLAGVSLSQAAEVSSEPTVMDEIVVSASRVPEEKREVTSNITVISREDIDRAVGRNVGDLLAEKGVGHIQKYPGSLTAVGLRGFRTDTHGNDLQGHVLILIDGRRAGTGNVAKLLTENVERIEIIRGPGAVQYGSGGMGGVVNIITRQGSANSLTFEAGGGSFDRGQANFGGTAKKGKLDFAGSLSQKTAGDYVTGSGQTYANTGFDTETGLSANIGYQILPGQRLGMVVTAYDTQGAGNPGYLTANDLDNYGDKSNASLDTVYTGSNPTGSSQWLLRYFFGRDENTWYEPIASNPSGWDTGSPSANTTDQQGGQAQITGEFGASSLTAGVDWLEYAVENSWAPQDT
ncbi:MAG: TonB-dependent receptor plug domain-containing protein, partial [Desulfoprunum sp.]|nr:TonB-dependent receptor plug domain-containing protein [Desulfoprunum sp.]